MKINRAAIASTQTPFVREKKPLTPQERMPPLDPNWVDEDYKVVYFEDCKATYCTDNALLVSRKDMTAQSWFPRKAVHGEYSEILEMGDEGVLGIHLWFAERNGLV